jgi:hypothetical protein
MKVISNLEWDGGRWIDVEKRQQQIEKMRNFGICEVTG